jgi:hypothetical protein
MGELKLTCTVPAVGETPYAAITSSLPDLVMGKAGIETTSHSSLRFTYIGPLAEWGDIFLEEIAAFHATRKIHDAFERTNDVALGLKPGWSKSEGMYGIGEKEAVQTSDEITMSGRFFTHAITKVQHVIDALTHPDAHTEEQLAEMTGMPKRNTMFGSAKSNPISQRPNYEPDIIVKITGSGDGQQVRLIGELKSPSTYKMHEHREAVQSFGNKSLKNLFGMCGPLHCTGEKKLLRETIGQIGRDMVTFMLRYAFISTNRLLLAPKCRNKTETKTTTATTIMTLRRTETIKFWRRVERTRR